jgi:hypothetical protein
MKAFNPRIYRSFGDAARDTLKAFVYSGVIQKGGEVLADALVENTKEFIEGWKNLERMVQSRI